MDWRVSQAESLVDEYHRTGDPDLLRRSVGLVREALEPHRVVDRFRCLKLLFTASGMVAETSAEMTDAVSAVRTAEAFFEVLPAEYPERSLYLSEYSIRIWRIGQWTGDVSTLEQAVDLGRQAVQLGAVRPELASVVLSNCCLTLWSLYERTGSLAVLTEAVDIGRRTVAADEASVDALSKLEVALRALYEHTDDEAALQEAVELGRRVVSQADIDDPDYGGYLTNLTLGLLAMASETGDQQLISEAISVARESVEHAPEDKVGGAVVRANLALAFMVMGQTIDDEPALQEAVRWYQAAIDLLPDQHALRARFLSNFGVVLVELYRRTGVERLLVVALRAGFEAVQRAEEDHPELPERTHRHRQACSLLLDAVGVDGLLRVLSSRLDAGPVPEAQALADLAFRVVIGYDVPAEMVRVLVNELNRLFEVTHQLADLQRAIDVCLRARQVTQPSDPAYPSLMHVFGRDLLQRFEWDRSADTVAEAVEAIRQAVGAGPDDADRLSDFSVALYRHYETTGDPDVLREALAHGAKTLDLLGPDDPGRGVRLVNQAVGTRMLGEHTGDRAILQAAAALARQAVAATADDPLGNRNALTGLGQALFELARADRDEHLFEEALRAVRQAADQSAPEDPHAGATYVNVMATLREWFEAENQPAALEAAAETARWALDQVHATSVYRPRICAESSTILRMIFERGGDSHYAEQAVVLAREALAGTPDTDSRRARYFNDFANALRVLGESRNDPSMVGEAVTAAEQALEVSPDNLVYLSNLTGIRVALGKLTGAPATLRAAVAAGRQAVAAIPAGNAAPRDAALASSTLTAALVLLFEATGEVASLREAVQVARDALDATPPGYRDRPTYLLNLGGTLERLGEATGDRQPLLEAIDVLRASYGITTAPPKWRIEAARAVGRIARTVDDTDAALRAAETAVELVTTLAPSSYVSGDREALFGRIVGLAGEAAAAAVAAGQTARAVELLEQARGVLLAEGIAAWDDMATLAGHDAELATEVADVRARMRYPSANVDERRDLETRWHRLLDEVRILPGLESFLRPQPFRDLAAGAGAPVVYMVATNDIAFAIAVHDGGPVLIDLPGVDQKVVGRQVTALLVSLAFLRSATATDNERSTALGSLSEVLEWLWDALTAPVLDSLGYQERLWWCPTGLLSLLPLHAAGHHRAKDGRAVMDRVISSYTPTLRALQQAQRREPARKATTLVVAMPETPGAGDLPGVDSEAQVVCGTTLASRLLRGPEATYESVMAALPDHAIAHFACHGQPGQESPSQSRLLIHDHRDRPLTVAAISELRLKDAELAYLSACATSNVTPPLVDEVLHITSAFQMAGYRQVVGTLWSITDNVAVWIANRFYQAISAAGQHQPDRAAAALHAAVRELRDAAPDQPHLWAAYIHVGC